MKKVLIIIQLILSLQVAGQFDETCGTLDSTEEQMLQKPWYYDNTYLDIIEAAKEKMLNGLTGKRLNTCVNSILEPLSVPIKFWIYEDAANNTPLPDDRELQILMDQLNFLYQSNGMNVRFYNHCEEIIDDADAMEVTPFQSFGKLHKENFEKGVINIHIIEDYEGAGGVYNSLGDFIVVQQNVYNDDLDNVSTVAHEIGHFFGLDHTHRNSDKGKCRQESINRNTTFTFGQFFGCTGKNGRVCEKKWRCSL